MERTKETFDTFWETLEIDDVAEDSDAMAPTRTLRPTTHLLDSDQRREVPRLPRLVRDELRDTMPELEIRSVLGEGGMGLVSLATQVPLGRDVAVKTLRHKARDDEEATLVLLREGWVTGILEHPNIVPIYQLGRDADGDPMIVMKRIEGVSWAELIRDPSTSPRDFDSDDPLDWHLDILRQVCNAVHFAHSKGIIHRDLKPDNVMIGAFGEVYVLDWGIAVGLDEDPTGRIPSVDDVTGPAGTPAYMAPEMVTTGEGTLSERTDVYLLGSVLHEVLTGSPPHSGSNLYQIMFAAYRSEPHEYGDDVPEQLAEICRRAMAPRPDDRFASAEEFRQAIADFSRHRESLRLSSEALERLKKIRELVSAEEGADPEESDADDEFGLFDVFGQARFGFEQALEVDPTNAAARDGLQETLTRMAEREIEHGSYRAASLLVADLPEPRPELERRLEALREEEAKHEEEFERLQRIRHAFDIEIGRASRSIAAILLGVFWGTMTFFLPQFLEMSGGTITHVGFISHSVALVGVLSAGVLFFRKSLFRNAANRRIVLALMGLLTGATILRVMMYIGDVAIRTGLAFEILLYGVGGSMIALTLDRRLLWGSLPYVIAAVASIAFPEEIYHIFGVTNFIAMSLLGWVWWPEEAGG